MRPSNNLIDHEIIDINYLQYFNKNKLMTLDN